MGQVVQLPQLKAELAKRRSQSSKRPLQVVFTNGCFDILHVGHTRYLQDAKALGDLLIVGLNADASVRRLKGDQRPIQAEEDRAEILAALGCVDYVVLFQADTPATLIEEVSPDILVKGGDWPVEKIEGAKFVIAKGGQVKSLPFHPGRSTTNLIKRIEGR